MQNKCKDKLSKKIYREYHTTQKSEENVLKIIYHKEDGHPWWGFFIEVSVVFFSFHLFFTVCRLLTFDCPYQIIFYQNTYIKLLSKTQQ